MKMQASRYSIYQICHYSRLAFCLFCALPPLVEISLRAHLLVAVALFMLYLGQNNAWCLRVTATRAFESINYTHENTSDCYTS